MRRTSRDAGRHRRRRHRRPRGRVRAARGAASRSSCSKRAPRAGGVILSEEVDGFTIDGGPDCAAGPEAGRHRAVRGARARRSAGPDQAAAPRLHPARRHVCTRCRPRRCSASRRASDRSSRTRLFSWPGKLRMGAELFVPRAARRRATNRSARSCARRFGREATTYLAEPLLAGIHAGDVDRLSVRALFPRFVEAERTHGSLLRAFRSSRSASAPRVRRRRVSSRCPAA